jgi:hypothetical protein
MFSIDGLTWDIPCDIERTAEISASEISGLMLDKSYFNDVLGTYMKYTIKLAVPMNMKDEYVQIYEAITNPADGHTFILPYNDSTITVTARVESISDVYVRLPNGGVYWKGIRFSIIANHPSKAMTLGQMVVAGRAPLPNVADPQIGDSYTYTSGGWVPSVQYEDADDIAY